MGFVGILSMSGIIFYKFYANPTFETWQYKSNPKYPSCEMVRDEIIQTAKGIGVSVISPALALWLSGQGTVIDVYCGVHPELGAGRLIFEFIFIVLSSDFVEFLYHYAGHYFTFMWDVHKHHHVFYNPSPFAVIADEWLDQFVRSTPLIFLPMITTLNIDLLFGTYLVFFYGYGVYLHWGFEVECLPADHPFMNTSFQHYAHHAISVKNKPYHTGFFFKIWDQLFGSIYTGETVISAMEARKRGLRTRAHWEKVELVDYSPLLTLSFWMESDKKKM
jgi:lathosterol oxidase